jgi:hypothetical protein
MMQRPRGRRLLVGPGVIALLLGTVACGSTVTQRAALVGTSPAATSDGLAAPGAGGAGTTTSGLGSVPGLAASGSGGTPPNGGAPATAAGSAVTGSAGGTALPQAARGGPGVTASTLRIGLAYQANLDAANRALGGGRITSGDQTAEVELLVKDINAHGGVGGRKLSVDVFAYDAQSAQPYAAQDQDACTHFTQDAHVFAVLGAGLTSTFEQCMEKAGTAVLGADIVRFSARDFARYPHFVDVQELDLDRLLGALVTELASDGWSSGWDTSLGRAAAGRAKLGVVAFDRPPFADGVHHQLVPLLRRNGLAIDDADVVLVQEPSSQSDISGAAAQVQNAVLRFRQDAVTHVILLDTHGGITQVFLNAADAQHYFPRYGMESGSGTQALLDAGIIRAADLAGARGLGWIPTLDLPSAANPDNGPWSGDDRRRCVALMRAGGQSFTSTNAESIALLYCDQLWLLDRALDGVPQPPTVDALMNAVEGIGNRAPAASLGLASYAPGKHVAVARGMDWYFDAACGCMAYGRSRTIA